MIKLIPRPMLRIKAMMLFSSIVLSGSVVGYYAFIDHAFSAMQQRIASKNSLHEKLVRLSSKLQAELVLAQSLQSDIQRIEASHRIQSIWQLYRPLLETSGTDRSLAHHELDTKLPHLIAALRGGDRKPNGSDYRLMLNHVSSLLLTLSLDQAGRQHAAHQETIDEMHSHRDQLFAISAGIAIAIFATFMLVFSLLVSPLRRMGDVAQKIGRGEATIEAFASMKVHLEELIHLRQLIQQMVVDLTERNATIMDNANLLVGLTQIASDISSQVRRGVIEETAISKDIFEDLREMREGRKQLDTHLFGAIRNLDSLAVDIPSSREQIDALRHDLQVIADISNSGKTLREDMSRLLDGFDDLVRDRMTLSNDMELLSKSMIRAAKSMTQRNPS